MDAHARQIAREVCQARQAARAVPSLTTGSLALDFALGTRGLPRGYITELAGAESSGKSTLALQVIAESQSRGGTAALIDAERSFDSRYAARIGVRIEDLILSRPDTGDQALEIAELLLRSQTTDLVVVDSAAALVPHAEWTALAGASHPGLHRRMLVHGLRRLAVAASRSGACVVVLDQLRQRTVHGAREPDATAAGPALALHAAVRVRLDPSAGDSLRITARVLRNRLGSPGGVATLIFTRGCGLSREEELLDLGLAHGLVTERESAFATAGGLLGRGREEVIERLRGRASLARALESRLRAVLGLPMPPAAFRGVEPIADAAENRS